MLTSKPTAKMIKKWKRIFDEKQNELMPDRKSGAEVHEYFCRKYLPEAYEDAVFKEAVEYNAMSEYNAEKLKAGEKLNIMTYKTDDVLVGIDITTGFFHIESEDTEKVSDIYDDLFVFRGLDEMDLKNFFLVAQYIELTER